MTSRRSLDLAITEVWRRTVATSLAEFGRICAKVEAAEADSAKRQGELATAIAQAEAATHLADASARRARRYKAEAQLAEAADQYTRSAAAS
ncbi:MAG: hypothetical protein ACHP84_01005 [Caulobacterales bacterium]